MLDAKHPASVNVRKLRCLECTAQDHSQDTHAMQRLCPGTKEYGKCSLCDVVLSHTKGTGCNVSKAQWTSKRHGDRLCLDCAANKRAAEIVQAAKTELERQQSKRKRHKVPGLV